jgi:hypothetical protein
MPSPSRKHRVISDTATFSGSNDALHSFVGLLRGVIETSAKVETQSSVRIRQDLGRQLDEAHAVILSFHRALERTLESRSRKGPRSGSTQTLDSLAPPASGSEEFKRAVRSKQLLPSQGFIEQLHWTRQALSKALLANRVFFLEVLGERYFPAFFADPRHERRHFEAVSRTLGDLPGAAKWQFFTTPKGSLGDLTPVQALDKGQLRAVRAAAEGFAQA